MAEIVKPHDLPTPMIERGDASYRVIVEPRTLWLAAAIVIGLVAAILLLSAALDVMVMVFIAILVAEGIRPLVQWLNRRHIPQPLAVLLIYLVFIGGLGYLFYLLATPLVAQITQLVNNLPHYMAQVQHSADQLRTSLKGNTQVENLLKNLPNQIGGAAANLAPVLLRGPVIVVTLIFNTVLVLLMAFFWLTTTNGLKGFVVGLFPVDGQTKASDVISEMGVRTGGYLRGVAVNMVVIGLFSGIGTAILGLPYPFLLGVTAGLTESIPIIGPYIGGAPAILLALAIGGPVKALEVAVLYLIIQQIESNTLVPLVMNRAVKIDPLSITIAILVGSALLGIAGAILGVPFAAVLELLVIEVVAPMVRRYSMRQRPPVHL